MWQSKINGELKFDVSKIPHNSRLFFAFTHKRFFPILVPIHKGVLVMPMSFVVLLADFPRDRYFD